ncbi:hypothetical protein M3A96_08385 [Helcobacillus massiliensis]|uniref:Uncharacterized protein n=1 Tax=Helcobacillus massiliensis TaxID=521392 RepID=A0A839QTC8_9MICO|nr:MULTISPECIES: hypothetical protein [Helcobacillus]MBB3022888.1 hypothetical protein [Helcobacillus massiliensis]MCG7426263.1 hypothetical protein [Helcobacillus sp. ACRRO]MCT1558129.1 hypothetical protein [Helcobacillus massiliensis]MCT2037190.1 hypothetical protein [Helcobacillus massiliensis]MCT2332852.1 hypothetical protein [Helcobacillus massiliensis]
MQPLRIAFLVIAVLGVLLSAAARLLGLPPEVVRRLRIIGLSAALFGIAGFWVLALASDH